jgi:hypothetical protein
VWHPHAEASFLPTGFNQFDSFTRLIVNVEASPDAVLQISHDTDPRDQTGKEYTFNIPLTRKEYFLLRGEQAIGAAG